MQERRDDAALVTAAQSGDMNAFESLVRSHTPAVYAHAHRFFGEPIAAEDAVQEVFVKVFRSLSDFDGKSSFSTWVYRITRNTCIDLFRAGKKRPLPIDPLDASTPHAISEDPAAAATLSTAIEHAMTMLPPEDRDALSAVSVFGLSYAEAAVALGVPAGTVKSRVFRARRTLASALGMSSKEAS